MEGKGSGWELIERERCRWGCRGEMDCAKQNLCMAKWRACDSEKEPKEKFRVCKGKVATLEACEATGVSSCRQRVDATVSVTVLLPPPDWTKVLSVLCCWEMPLKPTDKVFGIFTSQAPVLGNQYLQAPVFPERGSSRVGAEGWEWFGANTLDPCFDSSAWRICFPYGKTAS